ncbi:MAG: hypothetical protein AB9869_13605 [Verrucomicrobiia bacterium]
MTRFNRSGWAAGALVVLALAVAAIVAVRLGYFAPGSRDSSPPIDTNLEGFRPESETGVAIPSSGSAPAEDQEEATSASSGTSASRPQGATPSLALPGESAVAQRIIQEMAMLQFAEGKLRPEQAAQLREHFKALSEEGAAAVPAIRMFLGRNQDIVFDPAGGASVGGYSSLRAGLLDTLNRIGGPEAVDALTHALRGTAEPSEIQAIARYLENLAPGEFRQEVVNAARETLDRTLRGQLHVEDAGPLFEVLQTRGDEAVVGDLLEAMPRWSYYSTIALAGLAEDQGIPWLAERVQASLGTSTADLLGLQMLAQAAGRSPEAASALFEQARRNQIPDGAWSKVAEGLAGEQYQMGQPPALTAASPGIRTYHIASGNQNFHGIPFNPRVDASETALRRAVVEELLQITQSPAAVQALQNARAALGPADE